METDADMMPETIGIDISGDDNYTSGVNNVENDHDIWENLVNVRKANPAKLICGYLNINSLAGEYDQIKDILQRNLIDMLFLAETKIDASYPDAQFVIDNYTMWRADRNKHGGGVLAFLRSDLAGDRKPTFEFKDIESVGIEIYKYSGNTKTQNNQKSPLAPSCYRSRKADDSYQELV
ncbi:uncharacterized protein LOC130052406 isoform X3 [Ostrea edulis]|uniref:uncharacterized protein LOC130052406 isoform X3 n=1 Tax=Ostrea edulis TaxID=37623 RepID=UPI0024AE97C9|nr:uncharacterized protein LOC130052406 isoform X3 [Ostrea edulis]XP_056013255.1 uncharacterized protein LOC130052406 isoform X3 [Ostrea edulis]